MELFSIDRVCLQCTCTYCVFVCISLPIEICRVKEFGQINSKVVQLGSFGLLGRKLKMAIVKSTHFCLLPSDVVKVNHLSYRMICILIWHMWLELRVYRTVKRNVNQK